MPTPEQIFCWFVAILLIVVALRFLVKEKLSFALVLCLCAIGFAFFGLSGVQGLLKTGLLLSVRDSLVKYGERLESFQTNVSAMKAELGEHQALIEKHQNELADQQTRIRTAQTNVAAQQASITNQYEQIAQLQAKLASSQTNIAAQQGKLSDVTYWVNNRS